jgi:hypothetical protein
MVRTGLACMFITIGAVAASVTVASQPLNDDESLKIVQLARTQAVSPQAAPSPEEAAYLAAQAWLAHIAPRRRGL